MKKIDQTTSDQIKYCRIICIYFMIFVHLPPGLSHTVLPNFMEPLKIIIIDILGRGSVPALSCISGFLFYFSLGKRKWNVLIKSRTINLIIPMAFWNCVFIFFGIAVLVSTGEKLSIFEQLANISLLEIIYDKIFAINYGAACISHNFLRDIFICAVLAIPLRPLIKRFSWLVVIAALVIDLTITFQPIVMRGPILVFYILGMVIAQEIGSLKFIVRSRLPYLMGLVLIVMVEFDMINSFYLYNWLKRLILSVLVLDVSIVLASKVKSRFIDTLDRSTYLIFLGHNVAFMFFWGVWTLMFGKQIGSIYLLFFSLAPLLWVVTAVSSTGIIYKLPSFIQVLIMGRSRKARGVRPSEKGTSSDLNVLSPKGTK